MSDPGSEEPPVLSDDYRSEAVRFLERDFNATFSQMRHYDTMAWDVTKFSFIQLLLAITSSWAIYTFSADQGSPELVGERWSLMVVGILGVSYLFSLLAIFMLVRLRTYFVVSARYINEQRHFFLSAAPLGFRNESGFYTNFRRPSAYSALSSQMVSSYAVTFVASIMLAMAVGIFTYYLHSREWVVTLASIISGALSFISITWAAGKYLSGKDHKTADEAVFGRSSGLPTSRKD